jgi:ABC-type multidrug transport system permease subunit
MDEETGTSAPGPEPRPPARDQRMNTALEPAQSRGAMHHPLIELTLARMREFVREPEAIFWVFIFPVLLALCLGIAFRSQPPQRIRVAVSEKLSAAAEIRTMLGSAPELETVILNEADASRKLRTGEIELVIGPVRGGQETPEPTASLPDPAQGPAMPSVAYRYDPSRDESRLARLAADRVLQQGLGRKDVVRVNEDLVTETGSRYIDFLIPGLIGLNLMASGMWGIGFNVVDSRTKKLLKLLTATPMRRSHFLLGFMLSRLTFLIVEVVALVGFGWLVFGVKVQGSLAGLGAILLLGALTFAGLGLLVAARPRTIEAVSGWMNLVMLPMWLLSGSFFSYSRFPEAMQTVIRLLPLTALNDALRAIVNEGAPVHACWPEACVLLAWGVLSFGLALRIFRWQ